MHVLKTTSSPVGWKHKKNAVKSKNNRIERFISKFGKIRRVRDPELQLGKLLPAGLHHRRRVIDAHIRRRPARQIAGGAAASPSKIENRAPWPNERIEQQSLARSQIIEGRVVGSCGVVGRKIRFFTRTDHPR